MSSQVRELVRNMVFGAGAVVLVASFSPGTASAQGLFGDWMNYGSTQSANSGSVWGSWGNSGRQRVKLRSKQRPGTIIVSFGDRRTYFILPKGEAIAYPIAIPKGNARWSGNFRVSRKTVNPQWTPTASMRKENPNLPLTVKGGDPRNPLGVRALYVGNTLYRLHGTDAPWLIGQAVSRGCVRFYNKDIIDLYNRARVGTRIIVTWRKYLT